MTSDSKRNLTLAFAGAMFVVAAIVMAGTFWPDKKFSENQMFFSDDDGKTWFADDVNLIPPYTRNGKEAVGAMVYECSSNSKKFCGFLFRFPDSVKGRIEKGAKEGGKSFRAIAYTTEISMAREVKAVGAGKKWVAMGTPEAKEIMSVRSPDGSEIDQVVP